MAAPETTPNPSPAGETGIAAPSAPSPGLAIVVPSAETKPDAPIVTAHAASAGETAPAHHSNPPVAAGSPPSARQSGLVRKWVNDLSKIEALLAALGIVITLGVFAFTSFDLLLTFWNHLLHKPLDVTLRPTTDKLDVVPGKLFVTRVAVENYTDWYKPYVKLVVSLAPADNGGPAVKDAFTPPKVDPPDLVRIDPCGRVYVDVSARINVPGKYILTVASRPLYDVPDARIRREQKWEQLVAGTPQNGEPSIETITVIAHKAEDFGDQKVVEVMPDRTNCRMSVTLTAGQSYPYGLRISANTPAHSGTWFYDVDPAVGVNESSADTSDAAIANGAYIKWKVERMEALETREFEILLESRAEHDPNQWASIVKGVQFSVEALRQTEKP